MRGIRFRGKQWDNCEWVYGYLMDWAGRPLIGVYKALGGEATAKDCLLWNYRPVDPATVGQFTGLRDRNGTEIYEGDIVQDELGEVFLVEYVRFGYVLKQIGEPWCRFPYEYDEYEVIGNIHDNPELLEVE